jgi:putative flavoprotein involved in K+ transport
MGKLEQAQDWLDVVIIGAGASGIGCAAILQELGVTRTKIVERYEIGGTFLRWPKEMRFITPSFTSNGFGLLDLNAVTLNTSPAYSLKKEHPSGPEYAQYLTNLANYLELPIQLNTEVYNVQPASSAGGFFVETSQGLLCAHFVIWAAGEFQYPRVQSFSGSELCLHTSHVSSWEDLAGETFCIIGGYESGIDAAVNLIARGKQVIVLDSSSVWNSEDSDPSRSLSPYTQERLNQAMETGQLQLIGDQKAVHIAKTKTGYIIDTENGQHYYSPTVPVLATGFVGSQQLIAHLFEQSESSHLMLTENDESTIIPGLFMAGPQIRQEDLIFCFIYKFRQRFAVVINTIAQRLGLDTALLDEYHEQGMFLDNLSCCEDECAC